MNDLTDCLIRNPVAIEEINVLTRAQRAQAKNKVSADMLLEKEAEEPRKLQERIKNRRKPRKKVAEKTGSIEGGKTSDETVLKNRVAPTEIENYADARKCTIPAENSSVDSREVRFLDKSVTESTPNDVPKE